MYPTLIILILVQSQVYSACDANGLKKYQPIYDYKIRPYIKNGDVNKVNINDCKFEGTKTTLELKFGLNTCLITYETADEAKFVGEIQMQKEGQKCDIINDKSGDDEYVESSSGTGGFYHCGTEKKINVMKAVMDSLKKTDKEAENASMKLCKSQTLPKAVITNFEIVLNAKTVQGTYVLNEGQPAYITYTASADLFTFASQTSCEKANKDGLLSKIKAKTAPDAFKIANGAKGVDDMKECYVLGALSFVNLTVGKQACRFVVSDIDKAMSGACSDKRVI